jgi:IclR family acetate operon transcriptional repressor
VSNTPRSPMDRWMKVLSAFIDREEWGVRELATTIGLAPSVVHRILHEMDRIGLVSPATRRGHFRIGSELARLAILIADRVDIRSASQPILDATSEMIDETVILAMYSPTRKQFSAVLAAESNHTIRYIWESLRGWSDVTVGASGKGILAFLEPPEREAIIGNRPRHEQTALRSSLDEIRSRGYAVSHGERYAGAVGVAAPIRDATGRVVGDLIGSWPDNRTNPAKESTAAAAIVAAAGQLSQQLGFRG